MLSAVWNLAAITIEWRFAGFARHLPALLFIDGVYLFPRQSDPVLRSPQCWEGIPISTPNSSSSRKVCDCLSCFSLAGHVICSSPQGVCHFGLGSAQLAHAHRDSLQPRTLLCRAVTQALFLHPMTIPSQVKGNVTV